MTAKREDMMMPLDRHHVTRGLQVMIPLIMAFFTGIGINYLVGGARLLLTPSLKYTDQFMPLQVWGAMFLMSGLLMIVAMIKQKRRPYMYALLVCAISEAVWCCFAIGASFGSEASRGGWLYSFFISGSCFAVYRQLASRKVE